MIKIQSDRLKIELNGIVDLLQEWQERLAKGIPGTDVQADDLYTEKFEIALKAEMQLAASKLFGLAEMID